MGLGFLFKYPLRICYFLIGIKGSLIEGAGNGVDWGSFLLLPPLTWSPSLGDGGTPTPFTSNVVSLPQRWRLAEKYLPRVANLYLIVVYRI